MTSSQNPSSSESILIVIVGLLLALSLLRAAQVAGVAKPEIVRLALLLCVTFVKDAAHRASLAFPGFLPDPPIIVKPDCAKSAVKLRPFMQFARLSERDDRLGLRLTPLVGDELQCVIHAVAKRLTPPHLVK